MAERPILLNTDSRVFIKDKANCCSSDYAYHACMRLGELSKDFGDVTSEYCPDEDNYGRFVEVAVIRGVEARATTSLAGRLPRNYRSILERLGRQKCQFELQLHFGFCGNPSAFDEYEVGLVLENVIVTNYSTDALGALSPDEAGSILETIELSVGNYYYITPLSLSNLTAALVTPNGFTPIDITTCARPACFGCENCECAIYALGVDTNDELVVIASMDGGITWNITETGIAGPTTNNPLTDDGYLSNIMCFGEDIYFTTQDGIGPYAPAVYHINAVEALTSTAATITQVYDGVNDTNANTGVDFAMGSKIVQFKGNYYVIQIEQVGTPRPTYVRQIFLDDSDTTVTVYTASANEYLHLNSLNQYDDKVMLVGKTTDPLTDPPTYLYTIDGLTWVELNIPLYNTLGLPNAGITAPFALDEKNWLIFVSFWGEPFGCRVNLFCTADAGQTYSYNGSFNGACDVKVSYNPTKNVIYAIGQERNSGGIETGVGKIWRSVNGGKSWKLLPDSDLTSFDYNINTYNANIDGGAREIYARHVHGCDNDPNLLYGISTQGVLKFT